MRIENRYRIVLDSGNYFDIDQKEFNDLRDICNPSSANAAMFKEFLVGANEPIKTNAEVKQPLTEESPERSAEKPHTPYICNGCFICNTKDQTKLEDL